MTKISKSEHIQAGVKENPNAPEINYQDKMPLYMNETGTVAFVGIAHILPEDVRWRMTNPKIKAMICLEDERKCHCHLGCMENFATRCHVLKSRFPRLQKILMLFSRGEKPLERNQDMILNDSERSIDSARSSANRYRNPRYFVVVVNTDPLEIEAFKRANYDLLDFYVNKTHMVMTEKIDLD